MTARLLVVGLQRGAAIAREIASSPDLQLAGLVDLDTTKLAAVGDELVVPLTRRFGDLASALTVEAEIVVLALPTALHREMSLAALQAGYHVLCEKPLAGSLDDARAFREALVALGSDRRFMVAEQYRFADGVENMRRAIANGLIGQLAYVDHDFFRPGAWRSRPEHWAHQPNSAIVEMSVHHFDMWWRVTGRRPTQIQVDSFNPPFNPPGRNFGHTVRATLSDGLPVHYLTARAMARPATSWHGLMTVVGEEGTLVSDGATVTLARSLPTHDHRVQQLATGTVSYVNRQHDGASTTVVMIRELVAAIEEGRPHECDVDDNWPSFATAAAALESVETGRPVAVPSD